MSFRRPLSVVLAAALLVPGSGLEAFAQLRAAPAAVPAGPSLPLAAAPAFQAAPALPALALPALNALPGLEGAPLAAPASAEALRLAAPSALRQAPAARLAAPSLPGLAPAALKSAPAARVRAALGSALGFGSGRTAAPATADSPLEGRRGWDRLYDGAGRSAELSAAPEAASLGALRPAARPSAPRALRLSPLLAEPAAPAPEPVDVKGLAGLLITRTISIFAFSYVLISVPIMIKQVAGEGALANVFALGTLASIWLAQFTGKIIDNLTLRNTVLLNAGLRIGIALAHWGLYQAGWLNFGSLAFLTMLDMWLLTSVVATENALVPFLVGSDRGRITTMQSVNWLIFAGMQVLTGIALSGGAVVDAMGWWNVQLAAAAVNLAMLPLVWWLMPDRYTKEGRTADGRSLRAKLAGAAAGAWASFKAGWKRKLGWLAAIGVGAALFAWLQNALPLTGILAAWLSTTPGFKKIWANKVLRASMGFALLAMVLVYPLRNVQIPMIAMGLLPAGADIGLLVGQLIGGLFLGQMMASAALLKMPAKWRVPIQVGLGAAFAAMLWWLILPGSIAATLGGLGIYAALVLTARRIPDRWWLKANLVGLPAIAAAWLFWGSAPAVLLTLAFVGLLSNNTPLVLFGAFWGEARTNPATKDHAGELSAAQGALVNIALAFGYAGTRFVMDGPASLPGSLLTLALIFGAAGLAFFLAPRFFPSMAPKPKEDKKA